jgi:competence protein ComEC
VFAAVDLRLAAPVAAAWAVLAVAIGWPRGVATVLGLVLLVAGVVMLSASVWTWSGRPLPAGRAGEDCGGEERCGEGRADEDRGGGFVRAGRRATAAGDRRADGRKANQSPSRLARRPGGAGGRARPSAAVALVAAILLVSGVVVAASGLQGLAWQRSGLGRAGGAEARVDLVLRLNQPAKVRASPWGAGSVTAVGVAWLEGAEGGPGVPTRALFEGEPPAAGSILRFRARLAGTESADPERLLAKAIGSVSAARPDGWRGLVWDLRAGLGEQANPLLEGIALGDTSRLATGLDADLKATSLTHITAVSGAHVAIVLGAVLGLAALAGCSRWAMAGWGVVTLAGFAALIGPGPSVWRAVAMGLAALAGIAFGKTRLALGALAGAVLLVLLADPWLARSYGLLLSALATAGLIVLAPPLALAVRRRWRRLPRAVVEAAALTASAQLVCAPIITIFAGQISLTALPANLLAAPAVPVATISAMVSLMADPWSPALGGAAAAVGNWAAGYIGAVATWVAGWPLASISWPAGLGGFALAVAATGVLGLGGWWLARRRLYRRIALVLVAVTAIAAGPARGPALTALGRGVPDDWVAAVCDVGQGTAVAIRAGPEAAILVDAGPERGGVDQCLDQLGVRRLELVVLTHFHADHVGGLAEALRGRALGELVHGDPCGLDPAPAVALAQAAGAAVRQIPSGEPVSGQVGMVELTIHPSALAALCPKNAGGGNRDGTGGGGESEAANNAGLTVTASVRGAVVWCLGDLEGAGQSALLADLISENGPGSTVLSAGGLVVVAHHGSADQSERLAKALAPALAVMSAGQDNPYGHPSGTALELYGSLCEVRRTDRDGAVIVTPADLGAAN